MSSIAWHYTVGVHFENICASGVILPATAYVPRRERPIVWFTSRDTFEPTACKIWRNRDGTVVLLGIEQTAELGGGLVRLGVPSATLIPWRRLPVAARMDLRHALTLEKIARQKGSDPDAWFGTFEPVSVSACIVDVYHGSTWVRVQPNREAA